MVFIYALSLPRLFWRQEVRRSFATTTGRGRTNGPRVWTSSSTSRNGNAWHFVARSLQAEKTEPLLPLLSCAAKLLHVCEPLPTWTLEEQRRWSRVHAHDRRNWMRVFVYMYRHTYPEAVWIGGLMILALNRTSGPPPPPTHPRAYRRI